MLGSRASSCQQVGHVRTRWEYVRIVDWEGGVSSPRSRVSQLTAEPTRYPISPGRVSQSDRMRPAPKRLRCPPCRNLVGIFSFSKISRSFFAWAKPQSDGGRAWAATSAVAGHQVEWGGSTAGISVLTDRSFWSGHFSRSLPKKRTRQQDGDRCSMISLHLRGRAGHGLSFLRLTPG